MVNLRDMPTAEVERLAEHAALEAMRRRHNAAAGCERQEPLVDIGKAVDTSATASGRRHPYLPEGFTIDNLDAWMTFQPWDPQQQDAGTQVRESLAAAAKTIFRVVPNGQFRDEAIRLIIRCRMAANAAISFKGRF